MFFGGDRRVGGWWARTRPVRRVYAKSDARTGLAVDALAPRPIAIAIAIASVRRFYISDALLSRRSYRRPGHSEESAPASGRCACARTELGASDIFSAHPRAPPPRDMR